ncbi:hypothetical protein BHE74_00039856 [Ensete ventricosum]|nr:hypothetical protein BHE74_00039856 [Ensete ventricosum]
MSDLWAGSSNEHPVGKKPEEEHPALKKLVVAACEENPTPAQPATTAGKKPAEEHPAGTEEWPMKQSVVSGRSRPCTDHSVAAPFPRYCPNAVHKEKEKLPSLVPIVAASAREGA